MLLPQHVAKQQNGKKKISLCASTPISLMSEVNLSSRLWVGGSLPWKPSCLPPLMPCVCRRQLSAAAPFPKALLGSRDTLSSHHRPGLQLLCLPLQYPLPFGYAQIQKPRYISKYNHCPHSDGTKRPHVSYMVQGGIP